MRGAARRFAALSSMAAPLAAAWVTAPLRAALLAVALLAAAPLPSAAAAPGPHPALAELRVRFGAGCFGAGVAIHLGQGLFLTAGHLLDPGLARREGCPGAVLERERPPTLLLDGREIPAVVLRRVAGVATGEAAPGWAYPGWADLALLRIAVPPRLTALGPCAGDAAPGAALRVESLMRATPARVAALERSGTLGPARIDGTLLVLDAVLLPGESGGAVLAGDGCLAGLVSARQGEPGGRFAFAVPAATLRAFLAGR